MVFTSTLELTFVHPNRWWATFCAIWSEHYHPRFLCTSVVEIEANLSSSHERWADEGWLLPPGTSYSHWYGKSNAKKLELSQSMVDERDLLLLPMFPRALETLIYRDRRDPYYPFTISKEPFREALDQVSSTLEFLCIELHDDESTETLRDWAPWSFNSFPVLTKLCINYSLLIGRSTSSSIANHLPLCIEVLILCSPMYWPIRETHVEVAECFRAILRRKSSKCFTRLRIISQVGSRVAYIHDEIEQLALDKGVQLVSYKDAINS